MSLLAAAQVEAKGVLSVNQVAALVASLQSAGAVNSDMSINNPNSVLNAAFTMLGRPGETATVGGPSFPQSKHPTLQ